jgi:hypothetical protein
MLQSKTISPSVLHHIVAAAGLEQGYLDVKIQEEPDQPKAPTISTWPKPVVRPWASRLAVAP